MLARQEIIPNRDGKLTVQMGSNTVQHLYMPAVRIGFIGAAIVLTGRYDPDQHWLPIMDGAVLTHPPPDEQERYEDTRSREIAALQNWHDRGRYRQIIANRLAGPFGGSPAREFRFNYDDHTQRVLPFWEHREIRDRYEYDTVDHLWEKQTEAVYETKREFVGTQVTIEDDDVVVAQAQEGDWDEWEEEISPAVPLHLPVYDGIEAWCRQNCLGRFYLQDDDRRRRDDQDGRMIFERYTDWFHCKLALSGREAEG